MKKTGLDSLPVSKSKRHGRDGIAVRAFENEVYYVFANSVGSQGNGLWSAGDSKIAAPNMRVFALAKNRDEAVIQAELDLSLAGRTYARDAMQWPVFLRRYWKGMMATCKRQLSRRVDRFEAAVVSPSLTQRRASFTSPSLLSLRLAPRPSAGPVVLHWTAFRAVCIINTRPYDDDTETKT